ncbi:MAG: DUF1549 domain-containing protein [Rubripirellula sp.]
MTSKVWHAASALLLLLPLAASSRASDGRIDQLLAVHHDTAGIEPTPICDDATFLRRLSLDLVGRVPTTKELQEFLLDPDRRAAIDRRLSSDEHVRYWSQLWTTLLVGRPQQRGVEPEVLRRWVEQRLASEVATSQMVFELISAQGVTSLSGPVNYVVANRADPVMSLSRTFLSVQLDCAECHDHPHDRWTNDDYLAMKRFFQPTRFREVSGGVAVTDAGGDLSRERPVFLTGQKPHTNAWRRELALMLVQSKPFSRAMVNRTWHWLMGRGLIDPVDGLSRDNPAATPGLLDELAMDFRESDFQTRPLIRRICNSKAYQRASLSDQHSDSEARLQLFSARNVRPMLPEQWLASVAQVLDRLIPEPQALRQQSGQLLGLSRQADPARDPFDWQATSQTLIRQLSGETPAPLRDLDAIFLSTLARRPTDQERHLVRKHNSKSTLYALVHSNEFLMND